MRDLRLHNWMTIIFFGACGLFMTYCVFYLTNLSPAPQSAAAATASALPQQTDSPARYVLVKGQASTLGNLQLRYMGMDDDIILIDVTIVDLDPEYVYRHRIPRQRATDGFRVAGKAFRLLSINSSVLRLKPHQG